MRGNLVRGERGTGDGILDPGVIRARQWRIVDVAAERLPHTVGNDEPLHSEQCKPCSVIVPSRSASCDGVSGYGHGHGKPALVELTTKKRHKPIVVDLTLPGLSDCWGYVGR